MNKDWFEHQCLLWIIIVSAAAVCVSCQELTSTLREGNRTCPGEEVTFTCTVRGSPTLTSLALAWSSTEYIGQGNLLQFTTLNMPGMDVTSMINGNVTATITNNTNINGVPTLVSELRIVADQPSTVTCTVPSGGEASKEFYITAVPEAPQNVRAAETTQPGNSICIILVTWDPPAGILQSDIDHYTIYVSKGTTIYETTAIALLRVPNCRSNDIGIKVTTVTRFGCVGQNSSEVRPILLTINTQTAAPTDHSEATPEPVGEPATSDSLVPVLAAVLAVTFFFLLILSVTTSIVLFFFCKVTERNRSTVKNQKPEEPEGEPKVMIPDTLGTAEARRKENFSFFLSQECLQKLCDKLLEDESQLNTTNIENDEAGACVYVTVNY